MSLGMPDSVLISFRDQTTGRISDLLNDEGQPCAHSQSLLAYLAGALLDYRDEGVEFTPSIVLCGSIQGFLTAFPGAVSHTIGTAPLQGSAGPKILKDCAPLTSSNWFIFIERTDAETLRYGVFTYFRLPTAIPLQEGININPDQFSILIRKVSANTIEMRGAKSNILTLIFSTVRESSTAGTPVERFMASCCRDVESEAFKAYFARLLDRALTVSHGTILACSNQPLPNLGQEMQDAVHISPLLDFQASFSEFESTNSAESILALQRCEELLQGFLRCDGIIAFDTHGCVTAYRIFFRPSEGGGPQPQIVGGARRRAFEGLRALVDGGQLLSVLFRSQDGLTLQHGSADA